MSHKPTEVTRKHLPGYEKKVRPLREALEEGILSSIPNKQAELARKHHVQGNFMPKPISLSLKYPSEWIASSHASA